MTKKITSVLVMVAALAGFCAEGTLSLVDARGRIGDAVIDPSVMTSLVKRLSAADQKSFLADCNEAVDKMPGSAEAKAATYLAVNRAALKGAAKGNLSEMLAEVFATVPLESLTVVNERFAADLFNRAANPAETFTDERFVKIAQSVMSSVTNRMVKTDGAAVRDTFAILMFVRASNGTPADLASTLAAYLPDDARRTALEEWIPEAMSERRNYDPMIVAADGGVLPNAAAVFQLAGPQKLEMMLGDLNSGIAGADVRNAASFNNISDVVTTLPVATPDIGLDSGLERRPFKNEPEGYQWQTLGRGRKSRKR
jgi:hypothetical protein